MQGGYAGKFLNIDLSTGNVKVEILDDSLLRKYISGRGLAVKLLYERLREGVDPLSPENKIVITTGVLSGTISLSSSRLNITTKSPLTELICMGNCGGYFGPELKFAGFDGMVISGRSKKLSPKLSDKEKALDKKPPKCLNGGELQHTNKHIGGI